MSWGKVLAVIIGEVCFLFIASCNMILFRIEGEVVDFDGEPLPGVCVTSPQTYDYALSDSKGKFYITSRKPLTNIELIKSDYLPIQINISQYKNNKVDLGKITLIRKPYTPGVYYYDSSLKRYVMLSSTEAKRIKLDENKYIPSVSLSEVTEFKSSSVSFYVYRMPNYDLKMYKLKIADIKANRVNPNDSKNEVENNRDDKILIPDKPVMTHTRFISTIDSSLYILEPLDELEDGYYCINWGAFETPFPKIVDNYLFRVVKDITNPENSH